MSELNAQKSNILTTWNV